MLDNLKSQQKTKVDINKATSETTVLKIRPNEQTFQRISCGVTNKPRAEHGKN
jgi:hypothetical protein